MGKINARVNIENNKSPWKSSRERLLQVARESNAELTPKKENPIDCVTFIKENP